MKKHDPAFIEYAEYVDYGYSDLIVHAGVEYDKQILINSAVLARRIREYIPECADDIRWNPWDCESFGSAVALYLRHFYAKCFPIYDYVDSFNESVERVYYLLPMPQGFTPYDTNYEYHTKGSLMYFLTLQANAEAICRTGGPGHGDACDVLASCKLPPYDLHRMIGKIVWLITAETGVSCYSPEEARASIKEANKTNEVRLAQFLFLLRWLSNSTGIPLMDVDMEAAVISDAVDMEDADWVRHFIESWREGKIYLEVMDQLNAWTADSMDNLEFLLDFVRRAGAVTKVYGRVDDDDRLAGEIAELFISLSMVYDQRIFNSPSGFWLQMATAGEDVIRCAKRLICNSYSGVDHLLDEEI